MQTIHAYEINLITAIQTLRSPLLDHIFIVLNIFDYDITYFIIIILVWHLMSERAGFHLLYLQVINASLCTALKTFFAQPRPYDLLPAVKIVGAFGHGFPSGASSAIFVTIGFILLWLRPTKLLLKISALLMILLVGLTRMYLGAHFPSDVIGGYALGMVILTTYVYSINFLTKKMGSLSPYYQLLIYGAFLFGLLMLNVSENFLFLLALLLGAIIWHLFFNSQFYFKNHRTRIFNYISLFLTVVGMIFLSGIFYYTATLSKNVAMVVLICILRILMCFLMGMWLGASAYFAHYLQKIHG